jgi:hypothetical protein
MSGVAKFEDLVPWQKARALTREVYEMTRLPAFSRDSGLCGQIQRAAVSIGTQNSALRTQNFFSCLA